MLTLHDLVRRVLHYREEPEESDDGERNIEEIHRITRRISSESSRGDERGGWHGRAALWVWSCEPRDGTAIENDVDRCARDGLCLFHGGAQI